MRTVTRECKGKVREWKGMEGNGKGYWVFVKRQKLEYNLSGYVGRLDKPVYPSLGTYIFTYDIRYVFSWNTGLALCQDPGLPS